MSCRTTRQVLVDALATTGVNVAEIDADLAKTDSILADDKPDLSEAPDAAANPERSSASCRQSRVSHWSCRRRFPNRGLAGRTFPQNAKALVRPLFMEDDFSATKWDTAADKAWFANPLCRFIAADFAQIPWTKRLHRRLSLCFRPIAHYSDTAFWDVFFSDTLKQPDFLPWSL
jgi:hypothetical protein